jgi:hypothetical protein
MNDQGAPGCSDRFARFSLCAGIGRPSIQLSATVASAPSSSQVYPL